MKRLQLGLVVIILTGIAFSAAHAQTSTPITHLHQPSLEEFLKFVPTIAGKVAFSNYQLADQWGSVVSDEIAYRYFGHEPIDDFPLISNTFERLTGLAGIRDVNLKVWNIALIEAWLRDNQVDLDATQTLHFYHYDIRVTPENFKADAAHEWILEIRIGENAFDQSFQTNYLVAERVSKQPGDYRLIATPLPWFDVGFSLNETQMGTSTTFYLGDMTGNSRPDWLLAVGRILNSGGFHYEYGWLDILTWRDDKLISLVAPDGAEFGPTSYDGPSGGYEPTILPHAVNIELVKRSGQKSLQVLIRRETTDNWQCVWTKTKTFAWNGSLYRLVGTQVDFPQTAECAWRNAELAMAAGQFQQAITNYEAGLKLTSNGPATQYPRARLAIAYSLTGQRQRSATLINQLASETPASPLMAALISALTTTNPSGNNPQAICTAAYNVFEQHLKACADSSIGESEVCTQWAYPYPGVIGGTFDDYGADASLVLDGIRPVPEADGCDPARFTPQRPAPKRGIAAGPIWTPVPESQQERIDQLIKNAQRTLFTGHVVDALAMLRSNKNIGDAGQYLEALAYELLGQSNAAVANYRAITANDPESAWGRLAALHLDEQ